MVRPLLACDVLVRDELVAGRYNRRPTIRSSSKSLTNWSTICQDASLDAAIVDRLVHNGQVYS